MIEKWKAGVDDSQIGEAILIDLSNILYKS